MTIAKLAFLASHNGSSAKAITLACQGGKINAEPALMISNNAGSHALIWAKEMGLETLTINHKTHDDVDAAIAGALKTHQINWAACSGYMKLIGPQTIKAVGGNILNVHPALLPTYGGQGMYGSHVHRAVFTNKETQTGITIHKVNEHYDEGDIIAQRIVPLTDEDTAETIEEKVKAAEPEFYVETLSSLLGGN